MRFRKLRIAWSVFCGLACVLLIVFWMRSYKWVDSATWPLGTRQTVAMGSSGARLFLATYPNNNVRTYKTTSGQVTISLPTGWGTSTTAQPHYGPFNHKLFAYNASQLYDADVMFPHWLLVIICTVIAVIPWMRWSFSLRTLLIATTLVAVVPGLVVWAANR